MKTLTPIVLIIAAVALFFGFTDKEYKKAEVLKKEQSEYRTLLIKSKELQAKRDILQDKYRKISKDDVARLNRLLPDTVDNVRLILDISRIADNHGLRIQNISIDDKGVASSKQKSSTDIDSKAYGTIKIDFNVSAPYETFLTFLEDLQSSLRLIDIVELGVTAGKQGVYTYNISMQTYWLR